MNRHEQRMRDYDDSARSSQRRAKNVARRTEGRSGFLDQVRAIAGRHSQMLGSKRLAQLGSGEFGVGDPSRWNRTMERFINTVVIQETEAQGLTGQRFEQLLRSYLDPSMRVGRWQIVARKKMVLDAVSVIDEIAAQSVREQPDDLASCTPQEYERACGMILEKQGYRISWIGGRGDQGVDLIAESEDGRKIAIQCKKYMSPVGNSGVQEVYAGAQVHSCNYCIVVCYSGFTIGAIEAADRTGVVLVHHHRLAEAAQSLLGAGHGQSVEHAPRDADA